MVLEYVAGIKAAVELAKAVKASTDAIDDAKIKLQVAELIGALADAKMEAAESAELIASLQKQLKSKTEMEFDGSVYYRVKDDGEKEGPWCQACYDAKGLEVRLQDNRNRKVTYQWSCNNCGTKYCYR